MPKLLQKLLPGYVWQFPSTSKTLYLTFDDGPIPEVTPWVLETLERFGAKATFFCVGDNVRKHPDIFQRVLEEGHAVGNHTFNHLNGSKTDTDTYLDNVRHCAQFVESNLFRPPYGRLTSAQKSSLKKHYRIIMWDVLSADFDPRVSPEKCLRNVLKNAAPGSIILLHDSLKTERNVRFALPRLLEHFSGEGFRFSAIE